MDRNFVKKIGIITGVISATHATAQPSSEITKQKDTEKQEISYTKPAEQSKDTIKHIKEKQITYTPKGEQTMEDVLKYQEVQLEIRRQNMINAGNKLKKAQNNLKGELERLYEIHKDNPSAKKSIEYLLKKLENNIHELIAEKLKAENINMDDPEFRNKALPSLKKLVLKGDGPIGNMVISLGLLINQQVGDYSGQFSNDMLQRNHLSDMITDLTEAEWETYKMKYLYDNVENQVNALKSALNSNKENILKNTHKKNQSGAVARD